MYFNKFIFGDTLEQAIDAIPEEHQLRFYRYIKNYGLHGEEPELTGFELSTWVQMKFAIDNPYKFNDIHWNWKGGITPENHRIRESAEYKHWIKKVFFRDNYTCQKCGQKGGVLNAHHIKHFAKFPELRMEPSNGITLCKNCHIKAHKKNRGEI